MHVVRFYARDVHLNAFPDGKYRVTAQLTGNWATSVSLEVAFAERFVGFRRIEPMGYYVTLTKDKHLLSVDFEVVRDFSMFRLLP